MKKIVVITYTQGSLGGLPRRTSSMVVAYVRDVYSNGYANHCNGVSNLIGVRPVFNLKAEVLAQGSGTATDPYRISSQKKSCNNMFDDVNRPK